MERGIPEHDSKNQSAISKMPLASLNLRGKALKWAFCMRAGFAREFFRESQYRRNEVPEGLVIIFLKRYSSAMQEKYRLRRNRYG